MFKKSKNIVEEYQELLLLQERDKKDLSFIQDESKKYQSHISLPSDFEVLQIKFLREITNKNGEISRLEKELYACQSKINYTLFKELLENYFIAFDQDDIVTSESLRYRLFSLFPSMTKQEAEKTFQLLLKSRKDKNCYEKLVHYINELEQKEKEVTYRQKRLQKLEKKLFLGNQKIKKKPQ